MEIISTFDMLEMFDSGQSLICVGNAPSLIGSSLGPWIDSHDIVVRFNAAAMQGFEADVGLRTDILVTNPYPEKRVRTPLDGNDCRMVLAINPLTRSGDKAQFAAWTGSHKVLFTYTPDPGQLATVRQGGLTTGVSAFALLRKVLQPRSLSLCGYTMYFEDTAHSYWSDITPAGVAKHDMPSNARALVELLNASTSCPVTVTQEIEWLARMVGVPLSRKITVKPLVDPKWATGSGEIRPA